MEYKLDFRCGGNISMREEVEEKSLDLKLILERLNKGFQLQRERQETIKGWTLVSKKELAEYTINKHHSFFFCLAKEI